MPLAIFHCRTHKRYFTVYPLGWAPWLRVPLVSYTPEGKELSKGIDIFTASVNAAEHKDWPETGLLTEALTEQRLPGVFRTQKRHIHLAAKLLGIHPDLTVDPSSYAMALGLSELELREARIRIRDGPRSFRRLAKEGVATLTKLSALTKKLTRLMSTASYLKMWGVPISNFAPVQ